jgi:hypothetical protein
MTPDHTPTESSTIQWRKSSYSGPQGGNCFEVAMTGGHVLIRDSKHPHGARIAFAPREWAEFLAGIQAGEFDLG